VTLVTNWLRSANLSIRLINLGDSSHARRITMSNAALDYPHRIPRIARPSVAASPSLIRWTLRTVTFLLFGAATAIGVNLGTSAPEMSPASVVQHDVMSADR
jgi:hypothetical protein